MLSIYIFLIGDIRPLCSAYASFTPAEKFNTPAELIAQDRWRWAREISRRKGDTFPKT